MKKRLLKLHTIALCMAIMVATVFSASVVAATATPISTKEELNNIRNDTYKTLFWTRRIFDKSKIICQSKKYIFFT